MVNRTEKTFSTRHPHHLAGESQGNDFCPKAALARVERELSSSQNSEDQRSTASAELANMSINTGQNLHAKPE